MRAHPPGTGLVGEPADGLGARAPRAGRRAKERNEARSAAGDGRSARFPSARRVEFHRADAAHDEAGETVAAPLPGLSGFWKPFPVEYKRGKPKSHRADEVQLCAQAICLEEMLGVSIPAGALFYGEPRRRTDVTFDAELRRLTEETARGVRALIESGETPEPSFGKWCASCSLVEECRPKLIASRRSARKWLEHELEGVVA